MRDSQSMEPLLTSSQGVGQILDPSLADPGLPLPVPPFPEVLDSNTGAYEAFGGITATAFNRGSVIIAANNDVADSQGRAGSQHGVSSSARRSRRCDSNIRDSALKLR